MPVLPFGEYRPDVSDYEGQTSKNILNVVPQGDGYGPFKALVAYTSAAVGACRGFGYARKNDGSIVEWECRQTGHVMHFACQCAWCQASSCGLSVLQCVM